MSYATPAQREQNALLRRFHQRQQSRVPYEQNAVLSDALRQRGDGGDRTRQMLLVQMARWMDKLKYFREIKALGTYDKMRQPGSMEDQILKPERTVLSVGNSERLTANYEALEGIYKDDDSFRRGAAKHWDRRTNQPYKNIIKDERHYKAFLTEEKRKRLDSQDELIVHRVTKTDKDLKRLECEYREKSREISDHNKELEIAYSASKHAERKKEFEYNHVYKFRAKHESETHEEHKKSKIDVYKREQKKAEKDGRSIADVIESLVNSDVLPSKQLRDLGVSEEDYPMREGTVTAPQQGPPLQDGGPAVLAVAVAPNEESNSSSSDDDEQVSSKVRVRIRN